MVPVLLPLHVASSWYSLSFEDVLRITRVRIQSVVVVKNTKQDLNTFLDPTTPQVDLPPRKNGTRVGGINLFVVRMVVTVTLPIDRWRSVKRVPA
jgi:hypothetical protein